MYLYQSELRGSFLYGMLGVVPLCSWYAIEDVEFPHFVFRIVLHRAAGICLPSLVSCFDVGLLGSASVSRTNTPANWLVRTEDSKMYFLFPLGVGIGTGSFTLARDINLLLSVVISQFASICLCCLSFLLH